MPVQHPRKQLADLLVTLVPKTWRVVPAQRSVDSVQRPTIIIKQAAVRRTPAAPMGSRTIRFVLTLISRFSTDTERAEDDLDNTLPQFLTILDTIAGLSWSEAEKVTVDDKYLGYDIPIEVNTKKENL